MTIGMVEVGPKAKLFDHLVGKQSENRRKIGTARQRNDHYRGDTTTVMRVDGSAGTWRCR
jgi:hypothetical protein